MPSIDGTGPAGAGRMTGRGLGPCGSKEDAAASELCGRGMGSRRGMHSRRSRGLHMGSGCGMGFGRRFGSGSGNFRGSAEDMNDETRKMSLQEQRNFLKARLDTVDRRLKSL